jgi:uncharacterized secreted protein with C-terminal beta-propeller domain
VYTGSEMRRALLLGATAGVLVTALAGSTAAVAAPGLLHPSAAQVQPRPFSSCPALVGYARSHYAVTHGVPEPPVTPVAETTAAPAKRATAPVATPAATAGNSAATGSTSYSTTNNQEQGVDEPDIVKTNGSTIFTVDGTKLYAVAANGGSPTIQGSLDLGSNGYGSQLLLDGDRVLVISTETPLLVPVDSGVAVARPTIATSPYYAWGGQTTLTEVDVHDPSAMTVTQTMTVDGRFVDARQNGDTARIVISSAPRVLARPLLQTKTAGWVPTRTFHDLRTGRRFTRTVASCTSIRRPVQFSGLGMLTIVTVDLTKGLGAARSQALMADAQIVYGSQSSLYVATQKWVDPALGVAQLPSQTTVIDRFDVTDPDTTTFVASGEVPGYLLNQFSLSEYDGYLRVATTSRPIWWGVSPPQQLSQSYVTVLGTNGAVLQPVGQVSGLGQGEQIYSVRFIDDMGYVVTYRQVDPLYTIDLSTPTAPRVAGQLQDLSGYSAYLHPVGDGLLLGVGSAVDPATNEPTGTQLDLFDVSNAAAPKLVQQLQVGTGSSSTVQYDHHAFLFWPPTSLAVLPVQIYAGTGQTQFTGAIGYRVDSSGISEVGRVSHDPVDGETPAIERSLVIGDSLYTISTGGVMASTLASLTRQAFVAFPQSPTVVPLPAGSVPKAG